MQQNRNAIVRFWRWVRRIEPMQREIQTLEAELWVARTQAKNWRELAENRLKEIRRYKRQKRGLSE